MIGERRAGRSEGGREALFSITAFAVNGTVSIVELMNPSLSTSSPCRGSLSCAAILTASKRPAWVPLLRYCICFAVQCVLSNTTARRQPILSTSLVGFCTDARSHRDTAAFSLSHRHGHDASCLRAPRRTMHGHVLAHPRHWAQLWHPLRVRHNIKRS